MLRGLWALGVLVFATVTLGLAATAGALLFPGRHAVTRLARVWSRVMLRAIGVRPTYRGLERLPPGSPCIFISNHQSTVDIWALVPVLPVSVVFVAKQSLFRIPVLGWSMRAAGFIPIDRSRRGRALRSLERAAERIRDGSPVLLFAEGTRSRDGRLGLFKKGAFRLALRAGVPLVPVAISGTWGVIRPRGLRVQPGPVRVSFCQPIDVRPFLPDDVSGLALAVRSEIARHLEPVELGPEDLALLAQTT
jgi:1-acyl-sn-glycerol-3-phosphate acyltransferase